MSNDTILCTYCDKAHTRSGVKFALGEQSGPYRGGYCSAACYTKHSVELEKEAKSLKPIGSSPATGLTKLQYAAIHIHAQLMEWKEDLEPSEIAHDAVLHARAILKACEDEQS